MLDLIPEIFQYGFMQRAFIAGTVIAIVSPLVGVFLIMKRYAMMPDTLAHVSFAGVALGLLFAWNPILTALTVAVLSTISIEALRKRTGIFSEAALAIFLSGSLAIATIALSLGQNLDTTALGFLFGSISTITTTDVWVILILGVVTVVSIVALYKELFLISFDEDLASASGLPTKRLTFVLLFLTATVIALAMKIVGILLLGALIVIPVIASMQAKLNFKMTILLSIVLSLISVYGGILLSYFLDIPSGGAIVLILLAVFLSSLLIKK